MPPLLQRLTERKPENLDYLGVSYGLTSQLLRFASPCRCFSLDIISYHL
jgi:tRNA(Met) C34 N-acetyltransferase TmcA